MTGSPAGSSSRTPPWRSRGIWLAILAGTVTASLGVAFANTVNVTNTDAQQGQQYRTLLSQFYCLQDAVRAEVPQGSVVNVGSGPATQELSELIVLWATPGSAEDARWRLYLVNPGPCDGEDVRAVPGG